jgi:hypothetical protein
MASQTITHAIELIVRPGEPILTTPCSGLEDARQALAVMIESDGKDATTPEEQAMYRRALTKAATILPGMTISVGNGTAYALSKVS